MAVYALLVGIDRYQRPLPPLRGAVRDIEKALEFLRVRVPVGELFPLVLTDAEATRAAIIDGFRSHLAAAGPADTALFWFSGHGSQAPAPERFLMTEPTKMVQSLVCADSRQDGRPDLLDKEVRILLSRIADRGTHVVTVLDCCHSDSADRPAIAALGIRQVPPAQKAPPVHLLIPELSGLGALTSGPAADLGRADTHISLAACRSTESAYEVAAAGGRRGVFSLMLLRRLTDPAITYRELLASTRCLVETEIPGQHPVLHPVVGPLPDQPFLGGRAVANPATMALRRSPGVWHVDAGACHGMAVGTAADPMMLGLRNDPLGRRLRVVRVAPDRSDVVPVGWEPSDSDLGRPVVVTGLPVPRTPVAIGSGKAAQLVADALDSGGPAGTPSAFLQRTNQDDRHTLAALRVRFPTPETAEVQGSDGTPLDAPVPCATRHDASDLVRRLEHIARWRKIMELDNPCSALAGKIALDVVEVLPDEEIDPVRRGPLIPDAGGAVNLSYRYTLGGWAPPPGVFLRLRNRSDRMLFCVVLDLTDRFAMHPYLFAGDWVAPGTAYVGEGRPVRMGLPPGRDLVPGARGTDWFKVLAAETAIDAALFELPRLGEPQGARRAPRPAGPGGVVDRLAHAVLHRDRALDGTLPAEWTTCLTKVVIRVPG